MSPGKNTEKKSAEKLNVPSSVIVPPDYDPEHDKGDFMNPVMLEYFRLKLIQWREELIRESEHTIKTHCRLLNYSSQILLIVRPLRRIMHWSCARVTGNAS